MSLDTFRESNAFLGKHTNSIVLRDAGGRALAAIAPEFAGRVMFATYGGDSGPALGWINREVVAGKRDPKFVNFGGAERIWLSPEGGQYCTFFKPGARFDFSNWFVPSSFNDAPFNVTKSERKRIAMDKELEILNYLGSRFRLRIDRTVSLVEPADLTGLVGVSIPAGVEFAGYRTDNAVTNKGDKPMTKDNGLISIWILSMFVPSANTLVLAPVTAQASGAIVIDDYFGKVPGSRLAYAEDQACVVFKADGKERGKIGLPPARARDVVGSIDFDNGILTISKFSRARDGRYLKNGWQMHQDPFGGDVVNSYNDGPPEPGVPPLGGFYELENLSPARELGPGESLEHWSTVLHFHGPLEKLNEISRKGLGVDLTGIPKL